jgi:hypothetical protein
MRLQKGGLLGGTRNVVLQRGTFRCNAPIEMKGDFTSLVGETAVAKRDRELGRDQKPGSLLFEPDAMNNLLDELRPFFGKRLGAIKYPRFRASVLEVEKYIKNYGQGQPFQLKLIHLLELHLLNSALKRWRKYPNFDKIIADYKADYLHATCMIATASVLADQKNDLEITLERQGQRTPDLTLAPAWNTRVATEIKTPLPLREGEAISEKEAKDIVDKAFKSAGTQEGGQLSPDNQGILIIGSFYLQDPSLKELAKAAENNFRRVKGKRMHILGVIFTNINFTVLKSPEGASSISPILKVDVISNPEYDQQEFVRLAD